MVNKELTLSYGAGKKSLYVKEKNLAGFLKPVIPAKVYKPEEAFESALNNPVDSQRLENLVAGKKVCVTIEDYTRSEPRKEIVSSLSRRLIKADMVQYIVVTGTHNPGDERNLKIKSMIQNIAKELGLRFDVSINDSRAYDEFDYVGTTILGTRVLANKKALDADIFVVGSDMKPHYFAGYSAANKHFLPGMCAFDTIRVNHCGLIKDEKSNYGRHPWHYDKQRQENPLTSDMIDAISLIAGDRPIFTLAMISDGDVLWSHSGAIETVTRNGIKQADEVFSFRVKPVRHLVVSPGGASEDSYLYSGQRSLELASEAVEQDGEVLWLSECALGIHTGVNQQEIDDFHNAMMMDLDALTAELDKPDVKFHTYKAYRFKRLLKKIHVYGYSSLSDSVMKSIGIEPVNNPQEIIDTWLSRGPDDKIVVVDKANKLAVYRT